MPDVRMNIDVAPKRTVLAPLKPLGVGTADCESLPGYIDRLAAIHRVSDRQLSEFICSLPRSNKEPYSMREFGRKPYWAGTPGLFSLRLAALTGQPGVAALGMPWADNTIALRPALRSTAVWCSTCWREDLEAGRPVYQRKLWAFKFHERCHRHDTRLDATCPSCGSSDEAGITGVTKPGECRHCGSSLLSSENHSETQCGSLDEPKPTDLVARRFADLIADMPSLGKEACRPDTEKALAAIGARTGLVLRTDQAANAGVSLGMIQSPGSRRRITASIKTIARLAAAADLPIVQLLRYGKRRR